MYSGKVFQISLALSILTHGVILCQNSHLNILKAEKIEKNVSVNYVKNSVKMEKISDIAFKKIEPPLNTAAKTSLNKINPPPFTEKTAEAVNEGASHSVERKIDKPAFINPDTATYRKKITLPQLPEEKITNPLYINYYQIVREKIRRTAYQNFTGTDTGEVYLSFIISKSGGLKDIRIAEEKSTSNEYLQKTALRSVRESSPFPEFPDALNYAELSFNVVIAFEIE